VVPLCVSNLRFGRERNTSMPSSFSRSDNLLKTHRNCYEYLLHEIVYGWVIDDAVLVAWDFAASDEMGRRSRMLRGLRMLKEAFKECCSMVILLGMKNFTKTLRHYC